MVKPSIISLLTGAFLFFSFTITGADEASHFDDKEYDWYPVANYTNACYRAPLQQFKEALVITGTIGDEYRVGVPPFCKVIDLRAGRGYHWDMAAGSNLFVM